MPRVAHAEVRSLSGLSTNQAASIDIAIPIAATLVDEQLASKGLSDATLRNIELFLAAHFAITTAENGPKVSVRIGEASERYQDIYGPGLKSTRFGQQALILDTSGTLSALSARADKPMLKAEFRVINPIHTPVGDLSEDDV